MLLLLITILIVILLNILIPNHLFRKKIDDEIINSNNDQKISKLTCFDSKIFFTDNTQIKLNIYKFIDPETKLDVTCDIYDGNKNYDHSLCTAHNYINLEDDCTAFLLQLLLNRNLDL